MQSSERIYLSNLDHLRGFAAFMVFAWHFMHHQLNCREVCYRQLYAGDVHIPFFTLLEQGHTGVALFFCISGYIFTRLSYGKRLQLGGFWKNRLLRLLPLLLFVGVCTLLVKWASVSEPFAWPEKSRFFRPILHPGGSWTIYMELRYYLILPVLLFLMRRFRPLPVIGLLLLVTFAYRFHIWHDFGTAQFAAYNKLAGRMDQFLCGSAIFYIERRLREHSRHWKLILRFGAGASLLFLTGFYHSFSLQGGYYDLNGFPSASPLWIAIPLGEGICYSLIIAGYLTLTLPRIFDRIFAALGRWSYSIYLNHFLLLPTIVAALSYLHFMPDAFYPRLLVASFLAFPLIVAVSAATYRWVERPFLKLRSPYLAPVAAKSLEIRAFPAITASITSSSKAT